MSDKMSKDRNGGGLYFTDNKYMEYKYSRKLHWKILTLKGTQTCLSYIHKGLKAKGQGSALKVYPKYG